jgi:hypothetical protein
MGWGARLAKTNGAGSEEVDLEWLKNYKPQSVQ